MRYKVGVRCSFSAAHQISDYGGKCKNLHGHNFVVEAIVSGDRLSENNILYDVKELKEKLETVLARYDHMFLNAVLGERNVTMEYVAMKVYEELKRLGVEVSSVRVYESPDSWVEYEGV
ncbi:MAG: 6-carboxytetrahydropterin synthase [Candidatus Nanoarchaeia archaeon]|nr:6-carboxytetrahydropterin synthase [Candidatus Jingweiarchaeum tengchongense]